MEKGNETKRILILDAYARQTLPIVRGFKKIGCDVTVVGFSKLDIGLSSKHPDHKIKLDCEKDDYEKQERLYRELIKSRKYDLVVPMTDYSATILAKNKKEFSEHVHIAVADKEIFDLAANKQNTMRICKENNIPSPQTIFSNDPLVDIEKSGMKYPLVIKPKSGCGSIGFNIVKSEEHLKEILEKQKETKDEFFIQDYIPSDGPQYGAEAYRDKNGEMSFVLINEKPRWFPLDGGSPTINITIHDEQMRDITVRLLNSMNWQGYANIDFVMDKRDNTPKVLEVNARISAAARIDEYAGINVSKCIYEDAFCDKVSKYEDYEDGLRTSCLLTETLWFLKSKDRGKIKPSVFNRKKTKDVIFSANDLIPSITFCLQSAKNYKHAMKQRERD